MSPAEKGGKPKLVSRSVGLGCGYKPKLDNGCICRIEPERQQGRKTFPVGTAASRALVTQIRVAGRWPRVRKYPVSWTVPPSGHLVRGLERKD